MVVSLAVLVPVIVMVVFATGMVRVILTTSPWVVGVMLAAVMRLV
jgi:hypothetical protein